MSHGYPERHRRRFNSCGVPSCRGRVAAHGAVAARFVASRVGHSPTQAGGADIEVPTLQVISPAGSDLGAIDLSHNEFIEMTVSDRSAIDNGHTLELVTKSNSLE